MEKMGSVDTDRIDSDSSDYGSMNSESSDLGFPSEVQSMNLELQTITDRIKSLLKVSPARSHVTHRLWAIAPLFHYFTILTFAYSRHSNFKDARIILNKNYSLPLKSKRNMNANNSNNSAQNRKDFRTRKESSLNGGYPLNKGLVLGRPSVCRTLDWVPSLRFSPILKICRLFNSEKAFFVSE